MDYIKIIGFLTLKNTVKQPMRVCSYKMHVLSIESVKKQVSIQTDGCKA